VDILAEPGALSKGSIVLVIFLFDEKKENTKFLSHKGVFLRKRTLLLFKQVKHDVHALF